MKRKKLSSSVVSPRKKVLQDVCMLVHAEKQLNNINGGAATILNNKMLLYPWMTKDMVYSKLRRICSKVKSSTAKNTTVLSTTNTNVSTIECTNGGRPVGSAISNMLDLKAKKITATSDIARLCVISQNNNANGRLKRNEYKRIHDEVLIGHNLDKLDPHYSISKSTIDTRMR